MSQNLLFHTGRLDTFLRKKTAELDREIETKEKKYIPDTNIEQFKTDLVNKYQLRAPVIDENMIYTTTSEVNVDVSMDPGRLIFDRRRPHYVRGLKISYHIPFVGDAILFTYQPSSYTSIIPSGDIVGDEIIVKIIELDGDDDSVRKKFKQNLDSIKQWLGGVCQDVCNFNDLLTTQVENKIRKRRDKIAQNNALASKLGYPLRTNGLKYNKSDSHNQRNTDLLKNQLGIKNKTNNDAKFKKLRQPPKPTTKNIPTSVEARPSSLAVELTNPGFVDLTKKTIPKTESTKDEFKEFYQYDPNMDKQGRFLDPESKKRAVDNMKRAAQERVASAICAFANSYIGGFVYLGIRSDGTVAGLEKDKKFGNFPNYTDSFTNHIRSKLGDFLKNRVFISSRLQIKIRRVKNKTICIIQVLPSKQPIYLHTTKDKQFCTRGPSPRVEKLDVEDQFKYIQERFPNHS